MWSDEHSIAAGTIHVLDHEFRKVLQDIRVIIRVSTLPRWDVIQKWLLSEEEPDHQRDITVDGLVVGNSGADGVRDGDVSSAIGRHQPRHPQHRVSTECQRIQEGIVYPAVDNVHATQTPCGAHVDKAVVNDQVWTLDKLDAHFVGEERMFIVRAVERARGQENHDWVVLTVARSCGTEGLQELLGIMGYRPDPVLREKFREEPHHDIAVLKHVCDARRRSAVVFEDDEIARPGADDVNPGDVRIDTSRHRKVVHVGNELRVPQHQLCRDVAGPDEVARSVGIGKKRVECPYPLREATVQQLPFTCADQTGNDVERD